MPREEQDGGWNIYKHGGRLDTGMDAIEWAKKAEALGAGEILLTSMDCDGTKAGYDIELTMSSCRCSQHSGYCLRWSRDSGTFL